MAKTKNKMVGSKMMELCMNDMKVLKIFLVFEGGHHYESVSVLKQEIYRDKEVLELFKINV